MDDSLTEAIPLGMDRRLAERQQELVYEAQRRFPDEQPNAGRWVACKVAREVLSQASGPEAALKQLNDEVLLIRQGARSQMLRWRPEEVEDYIDEIRRIQLTLSGIFA